MLLQHLDRAGINAGRGKRGPNAETQMCAEKKRNRKEEEERIRPFA